MERHDHWHGAADDGYLREVQWETFRFLRQLQAILEWLLPQEPPYTRLDPPGSLPDALSRRWPTDLASPKNENRSLQNFQTEISKLEDLLSTKYSPAELGEYGTVIHHLGRRSFYGGFLDKRRTVPLLRRTSPDVIRFLEKVTGFGDYVKRENHAHFGIHYHYLNSSKRRSDTVLCFKPAAPWPLFAEKHAERSAHFAARPRGWSEDRRRAVYDVLSSEKGRFKAGEYRRPSSGSALVWQEDAARLSETKKKSLEIVLIDKTTVPLG
jgi:hypothetical protein